jgi:hypothetical protein
LPYGGGVQVVACSFCFTQQAAPWFAPALIGVVLLAASGLIAAWAAAKATGRRRTGLALVALALVVVLPAAALVVRSSRTSVDLDASYGLPEPGQPWRVTCETALSEPTSGTASSITAAGADACAAATAGQRRVAAGLAGVAFVLTAAGVVLVVSDRSAARPPSREAEPATT